MNLSDFEYTLPVELIASHPMQPRDQSRLMFVRRATGEISHHVFLELPELLRPADLMVFNNTKVFPARLLGHRLGMASQSYLTDKTPSATIEVLLLKPLGNDVWEVLVKPGRKMRVGERVRFGSRLECEVVDRGDLGSRTVKFSYQGNFDDLVDLLGHVPLPPYIDRPDETRDKTEYQTIFARKRGAVAAPTAGLHFTPAVLRRLRERSIETCEITLHVGLGTFQPIHTEQVEEHQMEAERFEISAEAAHTIQQAQTQKRRVVGVGTTVARTLESSAQRHNGTVEAGAGETRLFVYPGFAFSCLDGLLTNFHLPRSTLLMLVSAFAGRETILRAYQQAIDARYRFYSYGDCMLII
ncbi:MAG TPA: tRNA preQ1(34) S-adenosylmethionine ribosyltransferase-isomerase QueA [Terriglobia bacterium]|nr:tRNA preQ1(34) S-adenosylmethionine ribosyltransferase-isomerase QueA [Terriglobia bacterium]